MAKKTPPPPQPIAEGGGYLAPTSGRRVNRVATETAAVADEAAASNAPQDAPPPPAPAGTQTAVPPPTTTPGLDFTTATGIIDSALSIVGLDPNATGTMPDGSTNTLAGWYWGQITSEGLTDPTTIGDLITDTIPKTSQFQTAFPGYQEALAKGYVKTPGDYVTAEESATQVMMNYGVPAQLINPTTIGNIISGGVGTNELSQRLQNGFDAVENSPVEVQNIFSKWFGVQGPAALATLFLTPATEQGGQTLQTLEKMLGAAQISGAGAASNLTISQGMAQRLADQGQTYSSAQQVFKQMTQQAGLYEQTVGEANKTPVAGTQNANKPLDESTTGVEAAFGLNANAQQQVENEMLSRHNEFVGGGGATQTQTEGYAGLGPAKAF